MTIVAVNSISQYQTALTAVFDHNGYECAKAPTNEAYLLVYDYEVPQIGFGEEGRIQNSRQILQIN